MEHKISQHIIQGMNRDISPSKANTNLAYENRNIRITTDNDNNLLSITNEKGTIIVPFEELGNKGSTYTEFDSNIIGYCILNEYLILFVISEGVYTTNKIFRFNFNTKDFTILFEGNLNFNKNYPIEAFSLYENEYVQKVYWTDGLNCPRVINIVGHDGIVTDNTAFNFIPSLALNEEVTITRNEAGGSFSPGTIQYAFTYYNQFGSESNIFYTTELNYISYEQRGAAKDDYVSNSFNIHISGLERKFDYLRIYSIHRTENNTVPYVKIVADINLNSIQRDNDLTVNYTDTGNIGESIDPSILFYIGGKDIIVGTMINKDNTLFLGNITLKNDTLILNNTSAINIESQIRTVKLESISNDGYYYYDNQLKHGNTSTFKVGETYRLGLQFQTNTGEWSQPIYLQDYEIPRTVVPSINYINSTLNIPELKITIPKSVLNTIDSVYKKVRVVGVLPTSNDKTIIAQGVLNPTVYRVGDRIESTPFSQASWYFRPMYPGGIENALAADVKAKEGEVLEYRHNFCIRSVKYGETDAKEMRRAEIQNNTINPSLEDVSTSDNLVNDKKFHNIFYVDQSIVTFNSPDIEFDSNSVKISEDTKLRIIGYIPIDTTIGDISIQTSSGVKSTIGTGFVHSYIGTKIHTNAGRSLVSGLFYSDSFVMNDAQNNIVSPGDRFMLNSTETDASTGDALVNRFLVYPWQREGSLNNDINRSGQSSVLKTKVISNLKFSKDVIRFTGDTLNSIHLFNTTDILDIQLHNNIDNVDLVKLKSNPNSINKNNTYYGNVDTLLTSNQYPAGYSTDSVKSKAINTLNLDSNIKEVGNVIDDYYNTIRSSNEWDVEKCKHTASPVRMKYKSLPHAVISLNTVNNKQLILPTINASEINTYEFIPFWLEDNKIKLLNGNIVDSIHAGDAKYIKLSKVIGEENIQGIKGVVGDYVLQKYTVDSELRYRFYINKKTEDFKYEWAELSKEDTDGRNFYYSDLSSIEVIYYLVRFENGNQTVTEQSTLKSKLYQNYFTRYGISQQSVDVPEINGRAGLFLAELYRIVDPNTRFGGSSDKALQQNNWIPLGVPVKLSNTDSNGNIIVKGTYGDTWYQRYDCLKTIPFSNEDTNQMVEILSFMCETHINIDGRYDRNRGIISNLHVNNNNFNLINKGYSQQNNFFNYRILDNSLNVNNYFPHTITWSKEKVISSEIDTFTNITMANTLDLLGNKGSINSLQVLNSQIICFQDSAVSNILFNSRVQIPVSDGVPIEITNGYKVDGYKYISDLIGCKNKFSIAKGQKGLYFADNNTSNIYLLGNELIPLTIQQGFESWAKEVLDRKDFKSYYDNSKQDVYFITDNEWLCYSEKLGKFISFYDYTNTKSIFNIGNNLYSGTVQMSDKNTTLKKFKIYQHNVGDYNKLYDNTTPFSIEFISNQDMPYDKIFNTVEYRADTYNGNELLHDKTFDYLRVRNEYQTYEGKGSNLNIKKKFRIWRAEIGRDNSNRRDRIRNPWAYIKLGMNNPSNTKTELHDIIVHYYV